MVTAWAIVLALLATAGMVFGLRRRTQARTGKVPRFFPPSVERAASRAAAPVLLLLQSRPVAPRLGLPRGGVLLELAIIGAWALWIGRSFLDFNPTVWPAGREFGIDVYAFHFWDQLKQCGLCSLWNGSLNGGAPFLSDPFTGHLHPLAAVATLIAGVVNGAKITVVASFFLAGLGQWWLAKVMGLSRWARVGTALIATSGGYLVGRVELGSVADPLSASAAILTLAAAFDLALNCSRKAALRLALVLGLALLAGHGYYQFALVWWIPWLALLILTPTGQPDRVWREFALAGGLALLLAAIFLVPFVHFWPEMAKGMDSTFIESQPLEYIPINLVVHDWAFLNSPVLGKTPFPYLHTLFIGWPAVGLAGFGIGRTSRSDRRLVAALILGALTMMWVASGVPMRWLVGGLPFLAAFRHVANVAALAVPPILALSGCGLDRALEFAWPRLQLGLSTMKAEARLSVSLAVVLAVPLGFSLRDADRLDRSFLMTVDRSGVYRGIDSLSVPETEWVAFPLGEHYWVEAGLSAGLKITYIAAPWTWKDRPQPPPSLQAERLGREGGAIPTGYMNELPVYADTSVQYAFVDTESGEEACEAHGIGGDIRVGCSGPGGRLTVMENNWTGWTATVDGISAPLEPGPWLAVPIPSGKTEVRFRYLPADAAVGASLSLAGAMLLVFLWGRASRRYQRSGALSSADQIAGPHPLAVAPDDLRRPDGETGASAEAAPEVGLHEEPVPTPSG